MNNSLKIYYRNTAAGGFVAHSLEGFLTDEEIRNTYGHEAARRYRDKHPCMFRVEAAGYRTVLIHNSGVVLETTPQQSCLLKNVIYPAVDWSAILKEIKECSCNLDAAINEAREVDTDSMQVVEIKSGDEIAAHI